MYVKVTAGVRGSGVPHGDFLAEVRPPIHYDVVATKISANAEWDAEGMLVHPGDVDFGEAMGASLDFLHVLEFTTRRVDFDQNDGRVAFRYVWWHDPDTGLTAVVTTRNIFILGSNGKTIDRV